MSLDTRIEQLRFPNDTSEDKCDDRLEDGECSFNESQPMDEDEDSLLNNKWLYIHSSGYWSADVYMVSSNKFYEFIYFPAFGRKISIREWSYDMTHHDDV